MEGGSFLLERWRVEHDDVPDGRSVIGCDDATDQYVQCYADSRGISRVYQMSLDDRAWKLWRAAPGFSQRFTGTFGQDGRTITGAWETSSDGSTWEHDFDRRYLKVG